MDRLNGGAKFYEPRQPWYDVINVDRILAFEPLIRDWHHPDGIPRNAPRAWREQGADGAPIYVRNTLARTYGRHRAMAQRDKAPNSWTRDNVQLINL